MGQGGDLGRLLGLMLAEVDKLSEAMVARTREEIPSFERVPVGEHLADTCDSLRELIGAATGTGSGLDRIRLASLGSRRQAQGVPVEDLLRAWRISVELATAEARRLAEAADLAPEHAFGLFQEALGVSDEAMVVVADPYREEQGAGEQGAAAVRCALLVDLVAGRLSSELEIEPRLREVGLDPADELYGLCVPAAGEEELSRLRQAFGLSGAQGSAAIYELIDGEVLGVASASRRPGTEDLTAVGPVVPLGDLPASLAEARRLARAARVANLTGVQDAASAGLSAAVLERAELGSALASRYLDPVRVVSGGDEIVATVATWLDSGMRAGAAAEKLHIHPNTLRYRLRRFRELTGADLERVEQLVAVWWALESERLGSASGRPARSPG